MKLSLLHETVTTAAIAIAPMALGGGMRPKRRKRKIVNDEIEKRVLSDSKYGKESRQPKTAVWQGVTKKWRGAGKAGTAGPEPFGKGRNPILPSLGSKGLSYP